jgi:hypothetical protein
VISEQKELCGIKLKLKFPRVKGVPLQRCVHVQIELESKNHQRQRRTLK